MSAPTVIAATFVGGSLDGKWSYLPKGEAVYLIRNERYELTETIWHSQEDRVMSHQVYQLRSKS